MSELMQTLRQQGLSELACQFARFIERQDKHDNIPAIFAAAMLSEAISEGHVCLALSEFARLQQAFEVNLPSSVGQLRAELLASHTVGEPGEYTPMILTPENRLYLYRYWLDEQDVAKLIKQRLQPVSIDIEPLKTTLAEWPSNVAGIDWQKVAVTIALTRQLAVISGGPGTGKTTIVRNILHNLALQQPSCRVFLAAPTGKAAARLQQSLSKDYRHDVKTIHRLLGITEKNDQGRYSAARPLPCDVLIIDEASMIDITLMAKVLRALSPQARLILLGDSQQLASVESGAVLANLSQAEQGRFSSEFCQLFPQYELLEANHHTVLTDSFVRLQHSYRFAETSLIGELAQAINQGDVSTVFQRLQQAPTGTWLNPDEQQIIEVLLTGYQSFIEAIESQQPANIVLQAFEHFRVLTALRQGSQSVQSINRLMNRVLLTRGWRTMQPFYAGRPILITQNDYRQQLFNGDTGIILPDDSGQLRACFYFDDVVRYVPINRLPAHETAFAMTVHKSQGSEFDNVAILLPDEDVQVLSRELVYTALTRARHSVIWLAKESILRQAISRQHQRESGLADLLA